MSEARVPRSDDDDWLTPERYRELHKLADEAASRPAEDVARFLDAALPGDLRMRAEVMALLHAARALATTAADIGPGSHVGPYALERELGRGGMGTVYLARRADDAFDKTVAIKLVRADADSEEFLARFTLERRILASLDHPNIARLIDGGTLEDGRPYLVMEYVDGVPLQAFADQSRLTVRERVGLLQVLCGAVDYAHQQLVIHRDLKPANILVTADGTPKLLDFGIARALSPAPWLADRITATHANPGTPRYASPEQRAGAPVGMGADVYALGVIAYELLSGSTPAALAAGRPCLPPSRTIDGPHAPAQAAARGTNPGRLRRLIVGDLDAIVMKALSDDAADRYPSAAHLREDLQRYLDRRPVGARPPTASYLAVRLLARHRAAVVAAGVLLATLAGGITGTTLQWQRAEAERGRAERRFGSVRGLAASVLDISVSLGSSADSLSARDALVTTSLRYLEQLEREAGTDRGLLREVAAAYRRVGDVQRAMVRPDTGARAATAALSSYQRALRVSETLARNDPAGTETRRDLALSLDRVGATLAETGAAQAGANTLRRSLSLYEELLIADRNSALAQLHLAQAHVRYADAIAPIDPATAGRSYADAGAIVGRLSARPATDPGLQQSLASLDARLRAVELAADPERWRLEEDTFYNAIRESVDPDRLAYFLERFPDAPHSEEVRARLEALRSGHPLPVRRAAGTTERRPAAADTAPAAATPPPAPASAFAPRVIVAIDWRAIPAGTFDMGCDLRPNRHCSDDERPRHRVTLSRSFRLAASETTLGQYRQYSAATGQPVPPQPVWNTKDTQPIVNIAYEQAAQFCAAIGGRLPTEAEWEWAALGGRADVVYPWGNAYERAGANAGFPGRDGWDTTSPAGTFPPNGYGLYDMAGNVWEWVNDWYGAAYYQSEAVADPPGPPNGPSRVLRGGSYNTSPQFLRVTQRGRDTMDRRRDATGFRCAQ